MSDEKQIYTSEELEEMSRVDLRKLAVKTWGMDNKECSGTKSQALREWIIEQQEAYEGGEEPPKKTSKAKSSKASSSKASSSKSSGRPRPSAGKASPKAGARGRGRAKPKDEPAEEAPAAAGDLGDLSERLDALGKAVDENHEEVKEALASSGGEALDEIKDTLENIRLSQYILHGLVADLYRNYYEPEDLDTRVDELEAEFNEPEGND